MTMLFSKCEQNSNVQVVHPKETNQFKFMYTSFSSRIVEEKKELNHSTNTEHNKEICKKCGGEAIPFFTQLRASDEAPTKLMICLGSCS